MKKYISLILCLIICLSSCQRKENNDSYTEGNQDSYYILNTSTEKYHLPDCSYLPSKANAKKIDKSQIDSYPSYSPCGHCDP